MWPPALARQLRGRGHDVVAVAERPDLRGQPDAYIFEIAQAEGRFVVTENVADYRPLLMAALQQQTPDSGIIFTSNRLYPRADRRTFGRLVRALDNLLSTDPGIPGIEYWLS